MSLAPLDTMRGLPKGVYAFLMEKPNADILLVVNPPAAPVRNSEETQFARFQELLR